MIEIYQKNELFNNEKKIKEIVANFLGINGKANGFNLKEIKES